MTADQIARRRRRIRELLALGVLGGDLPYASYISNVIQPILWRRFQEVGGALPVNSGSASLTITQTAITQGQTGAGGIANEAADFNGTTSLETVTDDNVLDRTSFSYLFLLKPDGPGELNASRFYTHSTNRFLRFNAATMVVGSLVDTDGTDASSVTTNVLTAGVGYWVGMSYDDGGDRKIRIYINGVEAAYSTQTAATGTLVTPAGNLIIGNLASAAVTFDGLMDEMLFARFMTAAEFATIHSKKPPAWV